MKKLLLAGMMAASFNASAANLLIEQQIDVNMYAKQMTCKIYDNGKVDVDVQTYKQSYSSTGIQKTDIKTLFSSTATFKLNKKYIDELINAAEIGSSFSGTGGSTYVFKNKIKTEIIHNDLNNLNNLTKGVCYQHGVKEALGLTM